MDCVFPAVTYQAADGLDDAQREIVERVVREAAQEIRDGDAAYWLGLRRAVMPYAYYVACEVYDGGEPLGYLDFEEARADAAAA